MITRTIHEWEKIEYGDDVTQIPVVQADRLAEEARASTLSGLGGEGVLEQGRNGLRARDVVGVIVTPNCRLEILPKIESVGESHLDDTTLRYRLIHMLAVVWDIRIDVRAITQLGWQSETVLELLIRLFCSKLADAVRHGIPQQYTEHEDDCPTVRGSLNVTRQFSTLAVSPQKLACRFDARSPDIALNQVMRAAIGKLSRLARAPDNQRTLRELDFAYAEISELSPGALRWDLIVLDRTNTRWRELLLLARLFLTNRYQQTSVGSIDGFSLLFDMNVLFEKYVARLLARALADTDFSVLAQGGLRYCLFTGEKGLFQTRPDLIVERAGRIDIIIDTKWKRIAGIDDPKQSIKQPDIYQTMAYSQLYKCSQVLLLYPHHGGLLNAPVLQRYSIASSCAEDSLFVATLDVTGRRQSHQAALRELILDRLCGGGAVCSTEL